jgi:putative membrane protein
MTDVRRPAATDSGGMTENRHTPDRAEPGPPGRPDYTGLLAGERTFLAWIRTALALAAGAVAVVQLLPPLPVPGLRVVVGLVLGVAGPLTGLLAQHRWTRTQEAIHAGRALPPTRATAVLVTASVVLVGLLALVLGLLKAYEAAP